jgi:molybdenum cofactor synthesis domain-containing protein
MKFLKTISVIEFRNILKSIAQVNRETEFISLNKSFNRVISKDIVSPIDVPHFRKSKMDGYSVLARDTFGAEEDNAISLEFLETIPAGKIPMNKLTEGKCSYVATGAAIPENADAVVMVEYTDKVDNKIFISQAVTPGTNLINIGHDLMKGDIICKKGSLIDLPTIGVLSSVGVSEIPVYKKLIVGLVSTGDELVPYDEKNLPIGKIYDVNSRVLKQAIKNAGAKVQYYGIVRDEFEELENLIDRTLLECDITILSGGTSKGEGDLGPKVLEKYKDIEVQVHGVRIKPGKPILFAKLKEKMIFILPGYPTSALSCFFVFIDDFLRRMSGYPLKEKNSKMYEIGERIYSTVGRHEFKAITIGLEDRIEKIFPIKTGSEAISTMFHADGYIEIEELESIIEKGDSRRVFFF